MDVTQTSGLVSSAVLSGQSYRLPGPGAETIVLKSDDASTVVRQPGGAIDVLVGLQISIAYAPGGCNSLA